MSCCNFTMQTKTMISLKNLFTFKNKNNQENTKGTPNLSANTNTHPHTTVEAKPILKTSDIPLEKLSSQGKYIAGIKNKPKQPQIFPEDKYLPELKTKELERINEILESFDFTQEEKQSVFNSCKDLYQRKFDNFYLPAFCKRIFQKHGKKTQSLAKTLEEIAEIHRQYYLPEYKIKALECLDENGPDSPGLLMLEKNRAKEETSKRIKHIFFRFDINKKSQTPELKRLIKFLLNELYRYPVSCSSQMNRLHEFQECGLLNSKTIDLVFKLKPHFGNYHDSLDIVDLCANKKKGKINTQAAQDAITLCKAGFGKNFIEQCLKTATNAENKYCNQYLEKVLELQKLQTFPDDINKILAECVRLGSLDNECFNLALAFLKKYGTEPDSRVGSYLRGCRNPEHKFNQQCISDMNTMLEAGMPVHVAETVTSFISVRDNDPEKHKNIINAAIKLHAKGYLKEYISSIIKACTNSNNEIDQTMQEEMETVKDSLLKHKDLLKSSVDDLSQNDIMQFFCRNYKSIHTTVELLGLKTFEQAYKLKIDELGTYVKRCAEIKKALQPDDYDRLLMYTNPPKSSLYNTAITQFPDKIAALKKDFAQEQARGVKEFEEYKKHLNELSHTLSEAQKAAARKHDPQFLVNKIRTLAALAYDDKNNLNSQTLRVFELFDEQKWQKLLRTKLFDTLGMEEDPQLAKKLNLTNSKYLGEIFSANTDFKENCSELFKLIQNAPDKTPLEIFNELEQNIDTKKEFEQLGINYDRWTQTDKNSFRQIRVELNALEAKQAAIKNLEEDLNDSMFKKIPRKYTDEIFKAIEQTGVQVKENKETIYDNDGYAKDSCIKKRLYKNGQRISFEDLPDIISAIKAAVNKHDFWTQENNDKEIDNAKNHIYNHILKMRDLEINNAFNLKDNATVDFEIRKTDMNNIGHALFLGNHAHCCTAAGTGCNQFTAPLYIKNKCVSAIEISDGQQCVGNTMMYIAKINNEPALLLDNIELSTKYQNNNSVRDALTDYAKQICQEIGKPDLPVYAGPNRHKLDMSIYPSEQYTFSLAGSTGYDEIYLDFITESDRIDSSKVYKTELYKLR